MASVLHGNCLSVPMPHGHSHGGGGAHGHSHSHNSNKPCKSTSGQLSTLNSSGGQGISRKDDPVFIHGVINMHSPSIHTTHSRHNSFSKILPNGGSLLDPIDLNCGTATGGGGGRLSLDNHHHKQHNGNYTLLSMSNNEDGLMGDSHLQINGNCGGAGDSDENSGDEFCVDHHHADDPDDMLGGSGSDLKLAGGHNHQHAANLNIRAAMIHVIGDFVQSIGVLISAVVIKFYPDAKLIDPACTFVFSVIVFFTTIRIMRESLTVLLDATPLTINVKKLEKELRCLDGVRSVHHLNVFGVSVDWNVMMVHLVIDNMTSGDEVTRAVSRLAKRSYGIKHVTVQVERQRKRLSIVPPSLQSGHELI